MAGMSVGRPAMGVWGGLGNVQRQQGATGRQLTTGQSYAGVPTEGDTMYDPGTGTTRRYVGIHGQGGRWVDPNAKPAPPSGGGGGSMPPVGGGGGGTGGPTTGVPVPPVKEPPPSVSGLQARASDGGGYGVGDGQGVMVNGALGTRTRPSLEMLLQGLRY